MAITDVGKLYETTSTANPRQNTLGQTLKAGTLICLALGGTRSGSNLDVSAITDSKGNAWDWETWPCSYCFTGVAWTRIAEAMGTSDWIKVQWNGTPSKAWISAHAFEGASGTPTDRDVQIGTSSTVAVTLSVAGSDWLTFASCNLPYDYGVTMTPINSSVSQDDNAAASAAPWCECFSRNGTSGSTHQIGATTVISLAYKIAGVSFPFEAMPAPASRVIGGVIGV